MAALLVMAVLLAVAAHQVGVVSLDVVVSEVALLRRGLTSHLVVLPVVMLRGPPSTMGVSCREAPQWMVRGGVGVPGVKNMRTLVVAVRL